MSDVEHLVLVVHGVANRDEGAFTAQVAELAGALRPRVLEPVFWGDLGPADDLCCLPDPEAGDSLTRRVAAAGVDHADVVVERVRAEVARRTGEDVPDRTLAAVRAAVAGGGAATALSPEVAEALAEAVVLTGPVGSARLADDDDEGMFDRVRGHLRGLVDAVDRGVGRASGGALAGLLRDRSDGIGRLVARTVGDILAYSRNGAAIRARLDAAYAEARERADRVDLVAHSLGSLIAVEWLLGAPSAPTPEPEDIPVGTRQVFPRPRGGSAGHETAETDPAERRIDTFVTFGAQVSLFCELQGLLGSTGLTATTPQVRLPIDVGRWFNVWHTLDPLAFLMGPVLAIDRAGGEPEPVRDLRLDLEDVPTSFGFHSSYWQDDRFVEWLATTL